MLRRACAPELLDVEKEAVKIQANVRSWLLQRNYRNLRLSVTRFQAGVALVREASVVVIALSCGRWWTAVLRGVMARRSYEQTRAATTTLQAGLCRRSVAVLTDAAAHSGVWRAPQQPAGCWRDASSLCTNGTRRPRL
jgi:hypothetical protein